MKKFTAILFSLLLPFTALTACNNDPVDTSSGDNSGETVPPIATYSSGTEIPQRIFVFDKADMYNRLYSLNFSGASAEVLSAESKNLLGLMKGWYTNSASIGGAGFQGKIYTAEDAKYVCINDDQLKEAAIKAKSGDVIFIPSGVTIDMADFYATEKLNLKLASGVILASDRGIGKGATILFSNPSTYMLRCSDNVVITGINLCGVIPVSGVHATDVTDSGVSAEGENITVSNCEIASFSNSGILVADDGSVTVDHCYFHNNVNGISASDNATVTNSAFFNNDNDYLNGSSVASLPESNSVLETVTPYETLVEQKVPDITSALYPSDSTEVYDILEAIGNGATNRVIDALSVHAGTTNYYEFIDQLTIEKDGITYGIVEGTPVGGGAGYTTIHTSGDYTVSTLDELKTAISKAKSGEIIFIADGAKIDITNYSFTVPAGVTLASNRGFVREDGTVSSGGMLYTARRVNTAISTSSGSTVTGLVLSGSDTVRHMQHYYRGLKNNSYTSYYYKLPLTSGINISTANVTVTNCEIAGFANAAVNISAGGKDAVVTNNYIHHNQRMGYGYGVVLYGRKGVETTATISRNLFNFDRHSIAANGTPDSGYIADSNIHMGTSIFHIFDAHGGKDRGDGTDIACDLIEMTHNVFLSDKIPYKLRGTPTEYQLFQYNIVIYPEICYTYNELLYGTNCIIKDNIWGISDPVYSFEGGAEYELELNTDRYTVNMYSYDEYKTINSTECGLSGKTVLFFNGSGDGKYYLERYGKNIADGTTLDVPEGGFIISYPYNPVGTKLYRVLESAYAPLKAGETMETFGDFRAVIDGNVVTITVGTLSD